MPRSKLPPRSCHESKERECQYRVDCWVCYREGWRVNRMKTYFSRWRAMVLSMREVIVERMGIPGTRMARGDRKGEYYSKRQDPSSSSSSGSLVMGDERPRGVHTKLVGNDSQSTRAFSPESTKATLRCLRSIRSTSSSTNKLDVSSLDQPFSSELEELRYCSEIVFELLRRKRGHRSFSTVQS